MTLEDLASKYIASSERVFKEMKMIKNPITVDTKGTSKIIEHAKAYLDDARYYKEKKEFEVSLTSVAYCEGLLDALRLLGAVKFEWATREKERRREA
jgi:hypothetical protein